MNKGFWGRIERMKEIYRMWKMSHLLRDTEDSRYQDDVMEFISKNSNFLDDKSKRPGFIALGILDEIADKKSMTKQILRHSYVLRYYLNDNYSSYNPQNPKNQDWALEARRILNLCINKDNGYIGEDEGNKELIHLTGKGSKFTDDPVWRLLGIFGPKISFGLIEKYWEEYPATRIIIWSIGIFFTAVVANQVLREQIISFLKLWGFIK